jgi:alkanesulfonate monooxygenase SsuD/methylene tetrahydromethanopterin reductase-like flavin-dependent oxidoreductase (luciferase family)
MPAMRELRFGISVTPYAASYPDIVAQVRAAEQAGLDVVGIQDHPYQRRFLDTFALIGDLLARTDRLRFFPDVASLPMRGPVILAKTAASLDRMSGGRFELGLGAGTFWQAVAGMGGPARTNREAAEALEEAVPIIRAALDLERVVRGPGPHYPVPGYPPGPEPGHRVEIWIGALRPRGLRLIGQLADGWVPSITYLKPANLSAATAIIEEAAAAAGRDPERIRRVYNLMGTITDGDLGDGPLEGPANLWVERLSSWAVDVGIDTFVFWPPGQGSAQIERFAQEVVPAVRTASLRAAG